MTKFLMKMVKVVKLRAGFNSPANGTQRSLLLADSLTQDDQWPSKGTWKLNVKLLTPENTEELKRDYAVWRTVKPLFVSPLVWWKTVKGNIKRLFVLKGAQQAASKIIFRPSVRTRKYGETCSRFFFQKVHEESYVLSSLKEDDGSTRLCDMNPTESAASQSFLMPITEVLDDSRRDRLVPEASCIWLCRTCLAKTCWSCMTVCFLQVECVNPRGIITLIYKRKGEMQEIKNWWPIPLLNADYKILSKVTANQVRSALGLVTLTKLVLKDVSLRGVTIPHSRGQQVKASLYMDDVAVLCSDPLSVHQLMRIGDQFELASGTKKFARKSTFDPQSIRKWSACSVLETLREKERVDPVTWFPEQTVKVIWQNASSPGLSNKLQDIAWLV
eukprot:g41360.t1